ncbi:MAG TPA: BTAD domain-containing putative transcriptional regulator [Nocardioides sp.]|uniref:ATP-binding protein n=1 Tax=Nocardioides sp. TaxID=35761 RepID=UPI002E30801E|nr:BTAD domain-containing putative transcriptional regulator [Nocardioides sp.]HEX5087011.1 BTAD domain-containing putative transcriptional regulator [Nocardioides sp.]
MIALRLLDEVSWQGTPLPGGRTHALLAALAAAGGQVGEERLVDEVWGPDDVPANPAKALQVVVSRARAQTAPEAVARTDHGYRLGLAPDAVDALALRDAVVGAREAEGRHDLVQARDLARTALALPEPGSAADGPLGELRLQAARHRAVARAVLGRALSGLGDHGEALPLLEAAAGSASSDEATVAALLRSTAAVRGAPAALERYEQHREQLIDRLGVDPGPALQAVHAELLAADRPVRAGLRFEATSLVGRDEDIRALRAAVRDARVTSILGPGGLGKTRLAHLLGREAEQPVVHFVELVGVASSEDVVGEVGSALGVRDSVSGRRVLTSEQRNDVRARIAQLLDQAPTLLILDNCEHVVEAVAELVAFLVASCRRLRVVTTTRAPLSIAAERVFPLGQLSEDAAADLFGQRATGARPGVPLDDEAVRRVVRRLDGLPLAIELAAAKVRVMSVEDIDRRLDDRFALLRGGDRSAPDRHQTLVAVIDWSWNLLNEAERRALRWLSVFHDGFTLSGADELLGCDALELVQSLVDQSLLTVIDARGTVRYRMLETVREFGRMQLVGAGEDAEAERAQLGWARRYALVHRAHLYSREQVAAVLALAAEENNLADALRSAVGVPDPAATADLTSALASFWTIRGENTRVIAVASAVDAALEGWEPAPEEIDSAVTAAAVTVMNTVLGEIAEAPNCMRLLSAYGDRTNDPRAAAMVAVLAAQDPEDPEGSLERLRSFDVARGHDRYAAATARLWAAHYLENVGDPEGALEEAEAGLAAVDGDTDGPWITAMMHTLVGSLYAQLGKRAEAAEHARLAIPILDLLEANDDGIQARSLLAGVALGEGRFDEAERLVADIDRMNSRRTGFGGAFVTATVRAELALARGEVEEGLRLYRVAGEELDAIRLPGMEMTGLEPWSLFGDAASATAFAVHGSGVEGVDIYDRLRAKAPLVLDPDRPRMDYPVAGLVLHGLGTWGLLKKAMDPEDAIRLLVLADLFAYPRFTVTMDPARTDGEAERVAPGFAARVREEYAGRRGPALLPQAQQVVARITAAK